MQKTAYALLILIFAAGQSLAQLQKKKAGKLYSITINFQNRIGSQLLSLDSTYINPSGESFQVRNFRYYIHHISFKNETGKMGQLPESYFLIDERKPESKNISFRIPFATISCIQFSVGVDSSKNVSGVQNGALDPANGMFWTWNSGYIFAKLEGVSPQSKAPGHNFTYHIGGFRSGENAVRLIMLPINRKLSIGKGETITIAANVDTLLGKIKMAEMPSVMQPGQSAMQMADQYSKMFRVE